MLDTFIIATGAKAKRMPDSLNNDITAADIRAAILDEREACAAQVERAARMQPYEAFKQIILAIAEGLRNRES